MVQSIQHGRDPIAKALPVHVLGAIVEGEDRRRRILWTPPPEWVLVPHGRAATPDVRDKDNSLPASSVTTVVSEGPSPATPSVLPRTGVASEAAGGAGRAAASGAKTIASGCGPSIAATVTSAPVGGTSSGYASTTVADATGAANSSACSDTEGGITSVASHAATSEGDPSAVLIARPTEGMGTITGGARPTGEAVAPALLSPGTGATSDGGPRLA